MFLKKDILLCCTMNEKLSNYFLLVHQSLVIFFFFRVMQIRLMSFMRLLPQRLPQLIRQVEQDVETVIHVLQPGPIGIVEHKFTDTEILEARATVKRAVDNWRRNWTLEKNVGR
ncbi:uncharacterized protein [Zea mays]|uniref:Uncharacterized protein n=2 Tax=Zea mays TaxID=4577 RepID=A0A1D6M1L7_MAIZE|nr:uncharacterized protein LOC100303962 isoform X1 [Zea mays]AQK85136.1 hypothetical protein ZEAMMB73_Zm00001d037897 [Zea mays]|eukprot:XP_020394625.1 uncharacterized protein LOC100303962 isoform X1 [Zea mays]